MKILNYLLVFISAICFGQTTQSVTGQFKFAQNQKIILKGFNLNQEVILDQNTTDNNGTFQLKYPANYVGAGMLEVVNGKKVIVLLNHENFKVQWDDGNSVSSLHFENSLENKAFDDGLHLFQNIEAKKSGINYLLPYYSDDAKKKDFFIGEMQQLVTEIPSYLAKLPKTSYVGYYLSIRILLADLQRPSINFDRMSELDSKFKNLNFNDERLLQSGLYYELLDTYFTVLENQGDQSRTKIEDGVDLILETLGSNATAKQEVAQYLFTFFEKKSLFESAEYIALSILNDQSCPLDDKYKALFEQYRKMAIGMVASDIKLSANKKAENSLSEIKAKYKLVVFGASWCPKCVEEIPQLSSFYTKWRTNNNLEIVFISLDTEKSDFSAFTKNFPWISSCDSKGWETQSVIDYSVFATPTMYLLDANNTIMLKPISAVQVEAWLTMRQ